MRNIRKVKDDDWTSEHVDAWSLEMIEEEETELLMDAVVDNCIELGEQVVELRRRINRLIPSEPPFLYLYSDLYAGFCDYAAYPKFKHILKRLE